VKFKFEELRFLIEQEEWQNRALIGGAVTLIGMILFPVLWILEGYGLQLMKQTMRGEDPVLPEWDDWGELFKQGLTIFGIRFVYSIPLLVFVFVIVGFIILSVIIQIGGAGIAAGVDEAAGIITASLGIVVYVFAMLALVIVMPLQLVILYFGQVAVIRYAETRVMRDALDFNTVFSMAKNGFKQYIIAFIIWYGMVFAVSFVFQILIYTIIFILVMPFVYAALGYFSSVIMYTLFGKAHYQVLQSKDAAPAV